MIVVRTANDKTATVLRNSKKIFDEKRTSVTITNSVTLTPGNTAIFIASVETTIQTKITYIKLKGTGVTI